MKPSFFETATLIESQYWLVFNRLVEQVDVPGQDLHGHEAYQRLRQNHHHNKNLTGASQSYIWFDTCSHGAVSTAPLTFHSSTKHLRKMGNTKGWVTLTTPASTPCPSR